MGLGASMRLPLNTTDILQAISHRFKDARVIAQGGMGCLVRATDSETGRPVAIKFQAPAIRKERSAELSSRFVREARILARLSHPYIVSVLEVRDDGSKPYFVMEWVEGQTLSDHIDALSEIDVMQHLHLALDMCDAMEYAHQNSVIHRDLKPSNVMLLPGGGLKILDFGLARIMEHEVTEITRVGDVMGTPTYMAPEQLQGAPCDHRVDIYALGCIVYALLTRRPPFGPENYFAKLVADPSPPSSLNPQVTSDLDSIVMTAIARRKEDRYRSVLEFKQALSTWLLAVTPSCGSPPTGTDWREVLKTDLEQLNSWVPARHRATELREGILRDVVRLALSLGEQSDRQTADDEGATSFVATRILCLVANEVTRFGGEVGRYDASGLVAYFGHRTTSELDCERAVSVGIAMLGKIECVNRHITSRGLRFSATVTVDVARVCVDPNVQVDESVFETARSTRPPSGLWVTKGVRARVLGSFQVSAPDRLSGLSSVGGQTPRLCPSTNPGLFFGRAAELNRLSAIWFKLLDDVSRRLQFTRTGVFGGKRETAGSAPSLESRSTLVLINGEAGIGKSALAGHFLRETGMRTIRGAAAAFPSTPYRLVIDLLKNLLDVQKSDRAEDVQRSLEWAVARLSRGNDQDDQLRIQTVVGYLLGTAKVSPIGTEIAPRLGPDSALDTSSTLRDAIVRAVTDLFIRVAQDITLHEGQPLTLFLDDLQWIDDLSLELIEAFLVRIQIPVFVLSCARLPYLPPERWKKLCAMSVIEIGSLGEDEAAQLFRSCRSTISNTVRHPGDADLESKVLRLCGGHPLFLEEYAGLLSRSEREDSPAKTESTRAGDTTQKVRALRPTDELVVPPTIHTIVAARVDALPTRDREVLQLCAVLGSAIDPAVLGTICEELWPGSSPELLPILERLQELRFLGPLANAAEGVLQFRQSLVRTIVYATIVPSNKRLLHGLVGKTLESLPVEQRETMTETLAHHASQAAFFRKALRYAREALARAAASNDHEAVLRLVEHVLKLIPFARAETDQDSMPPSSSHSKGSSSPSGDSVEDMSDDSVLERKLTFDALAMRERVLHARGQRLKQREDIERMLDIAKQLSDKDRQAEALLRFSQFYCWQVGDFVRSQGCARQAFKLSRRNKNIAGEADALTSLACSMTQAGQLEEAVSIHRRAQELYDSIGHTKGLASSLCHLAATRLETWNIEEALALGLRSLEMDRHGGDLRSIARDLRTLGRIHGAVGHFEAALELYREALEHDSAIGCRQGRACDLLGIGQSFGGQERFDPARECLTQALELLSGETVEVVTGEIHLELSECLLDAGSQVLLEDAIAHATMSVRCAQDARRTGLQAMGTLCLGRCRLGQGSKTEALALMEKSLSILGNRDSVGANLAVILYHYGLLLNELGQVDPARSTFDRTASLIRDRAQRLGSDSLARTFLDNVRINRRVLETVPGGVDEGR